MMRFCRHSRTPSLPCARRPLPSSPPSEQHYPLSVCKNISHGKHTRMPPRRGPVSPSRKTLRSRPRQQRGLQAPTSVSQPHAMWNSACPSASHVHRRDCARLQPQTSVRTHVSVFMAPMLWPRGSRVAGAGCRRALWTRRWTLRRGLKAAISSALSGSAPRLTTSRFEGTLGRNGTSNGSTSAWVGCSAGYVTRLT